MDGMDGSRNLLIVLGKGPVDGSKVGIELVSTEVESDFEHHPVYLRAYLRSEKGHLLYMLNKNCTKGVIGKNKRLFLLQVRLSKVFKKYGINIGNNILKWVEPVAQTNFRLRKKKKKKDKKSKPTTTLPSNKENPVKI